MLLVKAGCKVFHTGAVREAKGFDMITDKQTTILQKIYRTKTNRQVCNLESATFLHSVGLDSFV